MPLNVSKLHFRFIREERIDLRMDQLKIHQIKSKEDQYFAEFWKIYSASFPLNERRVSNQQTDVFKKQEYQVDIYLSDNHVIGFIAFWATKDFIYIEHLAGHAG